MADPLREAARAVLGACLIDNSCVPSVAAIVRPEDFPTRQGRALFAAILTVHTRGEVVDHISVGCELKDRGMLRRVGGFGPILAVVNHCPSSVHAEDYARRLARASDAGRLPEATGLPAGALTW